MLTNPNSDGAARAADDASLSAREFDLPEAPIVEHLAGDIDGDEWLDWFQRLPERVTHGAFRDQLMINGLEAGLTLQAVGDLYGLSGERVRQIAQKAGVTTGEIKRRKREQAERRSAKIARHIFAVSLAHPELTIEELAEWADTDESAVRTALRHRVAVHEVRYNDWSSGVSDEELLEGLRQWAEETESHTGDSFTEWAARHGLPTKQIPTKRFGGWNNALRAAGLEHLVQERGGLRPQISDAMLWAGLLQFFRDDVEDYSAAGYDAYARTHGIGSLATLRQRLGSWADMKAKVRQLMRYAAAPEYEWGWAEEVLREAPDGPRNIMDEERVLADLRAVAARTDGPLSVQRYEAARSADEVNAGLIQKRCGSWVDALLEVGLDDRMTVKARRKLAERTRDADT